VAVAVVDVQVNSQSAVRNLQQVNAASKATTAGVNGLKNAVAGLVAGFGVLQAAKFVFAKTAEIETQTRSIQTLTGSVKEANRIIKELQAIGAVTPFTSTELIDTAKRLSAFGVSADKVVETTKRLGDVAGATGANLGELSLAYGQVIAKGRLQGEELLQFQERGVALQDELRKMYGLTGEEFSKALSKGQISAEAVEVAVRRLTDAGGKYANGAIAQSDTLNGKLSTLQDGIDALARRIGQALTPALKAIFNQAIAVVDAINAALAAGRGGGFTRNVAGARQFLNIGATSQAVDNIAKGIGQVTSQKNKTGIEQNLQALQQYQRLLQSIGAEDPNADRAVQLQGVILQKIGENLQAQKQLQSGAKGTQQLFTPPLLGGGGGSRASASDKAARDAERLAEAMKQQLKTADDQNFTLRNQLAILQETNADKKLLVQYETTQAEIAKRYNDLKAEAKSADEITLLNSNLEIENLIAKTEYEQNLNRLYEERAQLMADIMRAAAMPVVFNELEQQKAALDAILEKYPAIGTAADAAANLATNGIAEMVAGTKSAEQVFVDFLTSIANALLDTAKQMITQYIAIGVARMFAGIGGGTSGLNFTPVNSLPSLGSFNPLPVNFGGPMAAGGSVAGGTAYMVGERGPELFMPGRSGTIIPNNQLGSGVNVVVNVDAKGTSVQGDQSQGAALGRAVSAAVQAELIKQQRPGGLLAR
jgi:tape measure domain-containing protein